MPHPTGGGQGNPGISPGHGGVTPESWAVSFLTAIGAPTTRANIQSIVGWEFVEGGNWRNTARYNPLNTTQKEAGSTSMNSVGVQAYPTWAEGLTATATTIENGRYNDVLAALRSGKGLIGGSFKGLSTWSGGAYSSISAHPGYAGGAGATVGGGTSPAGGGSAAANPDCLVQNPLSVSVLGIASISAGPSCLFTMSNARAFIGAGLMVAGALIAFPGLGMLGAAAAVRVMQPIVNVAQSVPVAGKYVRAATASART